MCIARARLREASWVFIFHIRTWLLVSSRASWECTTGKFRVDVVGVRLATIFGSFAARRLRRAIDAGFGGCVQAIGPPIDPRLPG